MTPTKSAPAGKDSSRSSLNFDKVFALFLAIIFIIIGGKSLLESLPSAGEESQPSAREQAEAKQALVRALGYYGVTLGPDKRNILTNYLSGNVDVNEFISGQTLLDIATECGYPDIVTDILKRGANPNLRDLGWTPLYSACLHDNYQIASVLIEYGASVNESKGDGWTPLLAAASSSKNPDLIRLLIAHGANVNAIAPDGTSPLDLALQRTDQEGKVVAQVIAASGGKTHAIKNER